MENSKYYIEGCANRERHDRKMAHYLLFVEPERLVYKDYSCSDGQYPEWNTLILATTVYDIDYETKENDEDYDDEEGTINSGYKKVCLDYFDEEKGKRIRVPDDYRYYLQHVENFYNKKRNYNQWDIYYKEYDKRIYKRTESMAWFIFDNEDLLYLKEEFLELARKSEEDMEKHILWSAICCLRHNWTCQPNPKKFIKNAKSREFSVDQLNILVEKRNNYKDMVEC